MKFWVRAPVRVRLGILALLLGIYGFLTLAVDLGRVDTLLGWLSRLPGGGDELGHFGLFLFGGWMLAWAVAPLSKGFRHSSLAVGCGLLIIEEFSQTLLVLRTFSWIDLGSGLAGFSLGYGLFRILVDSNWQIPSSEIR